jgi:hypothetical protein
MNLGVVARILEEFREGGEGAVLAAAWMADKELAPLSWPFS